MTSVIKSANSCVQVSIDNLSSSSVPNAKFRISDGRTGRECRVKRDHQQLICMRWSAICDSHLPMLPDWAMIGPGQASPAPILDGCQTAAV